MSPQLKSQLLGLCLGLATAIGCIFYEKIVKEFSYMTFLIILSVEVVVLWVFSFMFFKNDIAQDITRMVSQPKHIWYAAGYILTGVTSVLWYVITKNQNVMAGSLYEVKYIAMLALIYIMFGDERFTVNTFIGLACAMCSVYFISKT